jgi:peptide-methionine (S)-S-oxide reductase
MDMKSEIEKATFGAGCFWGVEAAFRKVEGVVSTAVGFMGGILENPTYNDVCTGTTGHAEVVEVLYDSSRVSYQDLMQVFWEIHDPTTLNRQGPDLGTQYRSVIFYHTTEEEALARKSKEEMQRSGKFKREIVTQIEPAGTFWKAEEYHQQYFEKTGRSSCRI